MGRVRTGDENEVDGSGVPALPVTWRPRKARLTTYALAGVIVVSMLVLAAVLPPEWTIVDRAGVVVLGAVVATVLSFLARPRLIATEDRLIVVNIVRTRVLSWPEIIDIRMPPGEPWPTLDLADGSCIAAMGIQSNDGELARNNLARLAAVLHERGEAQEPGPPENPG